MKIIGLIIVISIGIVAWVLFNPDQQDNLLAIKDAIGIDSNNPYATQMRKLSEKQQSITEALDGSSSSLDGARIPDRLIDTQGEISSELKQLIEGLRKDSSKEMILLDIEDSGVIVGMRTIQKQLKDDKFSAAAGHSRQWARQMEAWAKELEGSD